MGALLRRSDAAGGTDQVPQGGSAFDSSLERFLPVIWVLTIAVGFYVGAGIWGIAVICFAWSAVFIHYGKRPLAITSASFIVVVLVARWALTGSAL